MKKIIVLFSFLLTAFASSSFANDHITIDKNVMASFGKDFATAREVTWEKSKAYVKFTFKMNDRVIFAYYNDAGDLIAISRNITADQLPIYQLSSVKRNFGDFWITNLFEINLNNETYYYITLESPDFKLVLRSAGSDGWEMYSREKKSL